MTPRRASPVALASLLLLVLLGLGAAEPLVAHTDDGCPTEVHCLPCRWGLARAVVPSQPPPDLTVLEAVWPVVIAEVLAPEDVHRAPAASRGPPLFS